MNETDDITHWAGIPIEHMNEDQLRRALKQAVRAYRGYVNAQTQIAEWREAARTHYGTAATVSPIPGWRMSQIFKKFWDDATKGK